MHILLAVCVGTLLLFFSGQKLVNSKCFRATGELSVKRLNLPNASWGFSAVTLQGKSGQKSRWIEYCVEWFVEVSSHCVSCFLFSHYDKAQIVPNQTFVINFGTWHHVFDTCTSSFYYLWCTRKSQQLLQKPKECKIVACWDETTLSKVVSCWAHKSLLCRVYQSCSWKPGTKSFILECTMYSKLRTIDRNN